MIGYTMLVVLVALIALFWRLSKRNDEWIFPAGLFTIIFGIVLVCIPIGRADIHANIAGHYEVGETLERARANDFEGFERATLQREVVESNKEVRKYQVYYKYWMPYIPAEILDVEMIE